MEFAERHDFYLTRREARQVARKRHATVKDLGTMAAGSYGVYPRNPVGGMVREYAVEKHK